MSFSPELQRTVLFNDLVASLRAAFRRYPHWRFGVVRRGQGGQLLVEIEGPRSTPVESGLIRVDWRAGLGLWTLEVLGIPLVDAGAPVEQRRVPGSADRPRFTPNARGEHDALVEAFARGDAERIATFIAAVFEHYGSRHLYPTLRPGPVHGFGSEGAPPRFWLNLSRELGVALRVHGFYVDDTGNEGPTTHANGVRIHVEGKAGRMAVEVSGTTRLEEIKVGWRRILDAGQINPREVANRPRYGADADAERDALNRLYVNRDAEGLARFVASATEAYDHAQLLEHQSGAAAHARYKLRRGLAAAFGLFRPR